MHWHSEHASTWDFCFPLGTGLGTWSHEPFSEPWRSASDPGCSWFTCMASQVTGVDSIYIKYRQNIHINNAIQHFGTSCLYEYYWICITWSFKKWKTTFVLNFFGWFTLHNRWQIGSGYMFEYYDYSLFERIYNSTMSKGRVTTALCQEKQLAFKSCMKFWWVGGFHCSL